MAGIGHGKWFGPDGDGIAGEDGESFLGVEEIRVDPEFAREFLIDGDDRRLDDGGGVDALEEAGREIGVGILERQLHQHLS